MKLNKGGEMLLVEDFLVKFKRELQVEFNKKYDNDKQRQYFDAFFYVSDLCKAFRKEICSFAGFLKPSDEFYFISKYFDLVLDEICVKAESYFESKCIS
jgi:hypothetical protein